MFINSKLYINCQLINKYFYYKHKGDLLILKQDIKQILDEYLVSRKTYDSSKNPIFKLIKNDFKQDLERALGENFSIDSYSRTKDLGTIPRIKIIDNTVADQDFYINLMYYFKADMSGLYLILKVPYERKTKTKYGKYYASYLRNKSNYIREFLEENGKLEENLVFSVDLAENRVKSKLHDVS